MSKNGDLYSRWLRAAADDIESAEWNLKGGFHHQVCFMCRQSAEKALKAFLYLQGEREAWGHSTEQLCRLCANYNASLGKWSDDLKKLDRFYIPTRYPNGVPSGTPRENYTKGDSEFALKISREIIAEIESFMGVK